LICRFDFEKEKNQRRKGNFLGHFVSAVEIFVVEGKYGE